MPKTNLPPQLAEVHAALSIKFSLQQQSKLLKELEALSEFMGGASDLGIDIPDILRPREMRSSITVGSDTACPVCRRPF